MNLLFLRLFNMSVTASWLVLAIVLLRLTFKKAPKALWCLLWAMVALRLLCPVSFESSLSLVPTAQPVPEAIAVLPTGALPMVSEAVHTAAAVPAAAPRSWLSLLSRVWILGMAAMTAYTAFTYFRIRRRLREAVPVRDNILSCDRIDTPFILGLFRPKIYLPSNLDPMDIPYVLAHEQAHLRRRDHWWKPLGYLLLTVYWFNPVLWLAYILLCRDIEMACDEKVMKTLGIGSKKAYSMALIRCSVSRKSISACPLAFGEVGVKERVKTVLNYKKPAFWVILIAALTCIVLAVCFLSNPKTEEIPDLSQVFSFQELQRDQIDSILLTNLHNGKETEITDPAQVQEILDGLEYIQGRYAESARGWSEGTYELTFRGDTDFPTVAFGDSPAIYTGAYGDGYPVRYRYYGRDFEELIRFLSGFDSSETTVQEDWLAETAADGITLSIQVLHPGSLLAETHSESGLPFELDGFYLEQNISGEWVEFQSDRGWSPEDDTHTLLFWMDNLPIGRHRVTVTGYETAPDGHRTELTLRQEFDIIGETHVPMMVPLAYIPETYTLSDYALDGCLLVGGTTVLSNQPVWDAFLEDGDTPIRIALTDGGSENGKPSQVLDVVPTGNGYEVHEYKKGREVVTSYAQLQRKDFENQYGSGYFYQLTNGSDSTSQVIFRQMNNPERTEKALIFDTEIPEFQDIRILTLDENRKVIDSQPYTPKVSLEEILARFRDNYPYFTLGKELHVEEITVSYDEALAELQEDGTYRLIPAWVIRCREPEIGTLTAAYSMATGRSTILRG